MQIDHVHFYTRNAAKTSNWLSRNIGFQAIAQSANNYTYTEVLTNNSVCLLISSPLKSNSIIADYLDAHSPGVADIAFRVNNLDSILAKAEYLGVKILQPPQIKRSDRGEVKWAKIAGWDCLQHTLIENFSSLRSWHFLLRDRENLACIKPFLTNTEIVDIDHLVLNVAAGELDKAVAWYKNLFGFEIRQTFKINTKRSGLYSEALVDPSGQILFNINEPTSADSQIQEFIEINQGAGIQHIALRSTNILQTVATMRSQGVPFLSVPKTYYTQLQQRHDDRSIPSLRDWEWQEIESQQVLVDWHPDAPESLLMQIFTQPIFDRPTFFWELIERRQKAQGFGEGNFQALFEAVEREQIRRY